MKVTPMKIMNESENVITKWLVTVNEYGIIPIRLQQRTKLKVVNMIVKYGLPFSPTCSSSKPLINSYIISYTDCQDVGNTFGVFNACCAKKSKTPTDKSIKTAEFVIEK